MTTPITPLIESLEALASKEAELRRKLPTSKEMDKVWRDFGNHITTFRTLSASGALPTAIELNLLRYSVASLEHHMKLLGGNSPDPDIRAARMLTEQLRAQTAESPVRTIVPRLRRHRPGEIAEVEANCPGCKKVVHARVENGEIILEFGD